MSRTKKIAFLGISVSLAMILSYIEFLLPPVYAAVPGIKIGMPNIIIIFILYRLNFKDACLVSFIRICLASLLFGTTVTFIYSFCGAVLSLTIMCLLKKTKLFSCLGVSVAGAVFHNAGQIIAAVMLLKTVEIGYYLIILIFTGTIAGILVGIVSALLINHIKIKTYLP